MKITSLYLLGNLLSGESGFGETGRHPPPAAGVVFSNVQRESKNIFFLLFSGKLLRSWICFMQHLRKVAEQED